MSLLLHRLTSVMAYVMERYLLSLWISLTMSLAILIQLPQLHLLQCPAHLQETALRSKFSYTNSQKHMTQFLARENAQPNNGRSKANFTNLGCPLLTHYKNLQVAGLELWEDSKYQKHLFQLYV